MKIRLMTFHTPKNYGAVLQGLSLMKQLSEFSDDVKVIDYNTPLLASKGRIMPRVSDARSFAKAVVNIPAYLPRSRKMKRFSQFVNENFQLTERYGTTEKLFSSPPDGDVFFTGSDQVFGPNRIKDERRSFYLDFVPDGRKRFSYAASFGVSEIAGDRREEIASYINKFDRLALRERSGCELVEKLTGRQSVQVVDPVFLHDMSFWRQYEKPYGKNFGHYLLYYRLLNSKKSDAQAERIARENGLRLVILSEFKTAAKGGTTLYDAGPAEFLWLYDNADMVVSNSFHGAAFSMIAKKQFVFTDEDPVLQERTMDLLRLAGIEKEAYIGTYDKDRKIDYDKVYEALAPLIEQSKQYIRGCLEEGGTN